METKKYICLLPTDGHQKGDIVELTEEQFVGLNANEQEPRFELYVEEAAADTPAPEETPAADESATAATDEAAAQEPAAPAEGEGAVDDAQDEGINPAPESGASEETPAAAEGEGSGEGVSA